MVCVSVERYGGVARIQVQRRGPLLSDSRYFIRIQFPLQFLHSRDVLCTVIILHYSPDVDALLLGFYARWSSVHSIPILARITNGSIDVVLLWTWRWHLRMCVFCHFTLSIGNNLRTSSSENSLFSIIHESTWYIFLLSFHLGWNSLSVAVIASPFQ